MFARGPNTRCLRAYYYFSSVLVPHHQIHLGELETGIDYVKRVHSISSARMLMRASYVAPHS